MSGRQTTAAGRVGWRPGWCGVVSVLLILGLTAPCWSQPSGGGGAGGRDAGNTTTAPASGRTLAEVLAAVLALQAQSQAGPGAGVGGGGVSVAGAGGGAAAASAVDSVARPRTLAQALAAVMAGRAGSDTSMAAVLATLTADSTLGRAGVVWDSTGARPRLARPGGGLEGVRALVDSVLADTVTATTVLLGELRQGFPPTLPFFGLSLFGSEQRPEAGWRRVPITPFYQLGPGDVIQAKCWGGFDLELVLPVADDGSIQMPGGDLVYVNGLVFGELEEVLLRELRRYYADALTPAKLASREVMLEVSLAAVRGVQVLVTGQVAQPGGYTFDSPSVLLTDALARAGGITSRGSLRAVEVRREGQTLVQDLYSLVVGGQVGVSEQLLRNGDVVYVPGYQRRVSIAGAVKQPAIFELAGGETLGDLVRMAGGYRPEAYREYLRLERQDEQQGVMLVDVDLRRQAASSVGLQDGDRVTVEATPLSRRRAVVRVEGTGVLRPGEYPLTSATAVPGALLAKVGLSDDALLEKVTLFRMRQDYSREKLEVNLSSPPAGFRLQAEDHLLIHSAFQLSGGKKYVTLSGHVKLKGRYAYSEGLTLHDLLFNFGGLADEDFRAQTHLERGDLIRTDKRTGQPTTLAFNVGAVLSGADDELLQSDDEVVIYEADRFRDSLYVTVEGSVRHPGTVKLKQGMTLADLLVLAGGLSENAYTVEAELSRFQPGAVPPYESRPISLEDPGGLVLENRDIVQVRSSPYWSLPATVTISGEVKFPGQYRLNQVNERLTQVLARAGGVSPHGFVEAARFTRLRAGQLQEVAMDLRLALKGDREYDLILVDGDQLHIPTYVGTVEVTGEVGLSQLVQYAPGKKAGYYVDRVGGYTPSADVRGTQIVRANRLVEPAHRRWWCDPAVPPGATIVVPAKGPTRPQPWWRSRYVVGALVGGAGSGLGVYYATR